MMPPYRMVLIDDHRVFSDGLNLLLSHSAHSTVVEQVFDSRLGTILAPSLSLT